MTVATLVEKLRSKKQSAERSAFSQYLELVRDLGKGGEVDSDEASVILSAAGKTEDDLSRDVNIQQQRLTWHATMLANRQAVSDRIQAERDLQAAQQALNAAVAKLEPAVQAARQRLDNANHAALVTAGAESWLAGNALDGELLQREAAIITQLHEVNAELKPLLADREHRNSWLLNAEQRYKQLTGRSSDDWAAWGITGFFHKTQDITAAEERVRDVKNQLVQLEAAIQPRLAEQRRLQAALNQIHQEKLEP